MASLRSPTFTVSWMSDIDNESLPSEAALRLAREGRCVDVITIDLPRDVGESEAWDFERQRQGYVYRGEKKHPTR